MDWIQLISDVVSLVAWLAIAATALFMLKPTFIPTARWLARNKHKDLEPDFEKLKHQAELLQLNDDEPTVLDSPVFSSLEDQIMDALERSPSAAILIAWSALETAVAAAVAQMAIATETPSYRSPMHNVEVLIRHGKLSKKQGMLLQEMRVLRNKIAQEHDSKPEISHEQAMDYASTAMHLIRHFEGYIHIE